MKLVLHFKDLGLQTLFLQPSKHDEASNQDYLLIRSISDIENPLMMLRLNSQNKFDVQSISALIDDSDIESKLDAFAVDLVEALQQGIDLSAEDIPEQIEQEQPYNPDLIRVDTSTMSLRQVYDMIRDNDIDLSPDFQRNIVWDQIRKSRLIESILLRIPLPVFYFSANDRGQLAVVDGLQRLTAIKEFMENKLCLRGLEYLNIDGATYTGKNKLDDKLYRRFNLTQITTNIIDSKSPTRAKYDIFRRLNTGGRPLNSQELRNCLSPEPLRNTLRLMAKSACFRDAMTNSVSDVRMEAQEYALRFIYFRDLYLHNHNGVEAYPGTMDYTLDAFVDSVQQNDNFPFDTYIQDFEKAMINAKYLFGRHAFRKVYETTSYDGVRSVVNKALFISWAVCLADYDPEFIADKFLEFSWVSILGQEISSDETYNYLLSYGTNGWKNIIYSFAKAKEIINSKLFDVDA